MKPIVATQRQLAVMVNVAFLLAWVSMKLSLPALPVLQSVFHTNQDAIKLSVALFFICYACSQLVWGVFGESSGRRHPLLLGLFISIIGTVMVIFSNTISLYIIGHCIEGIGVGAMSPLSRAVLADRFDPAGRARLLAIASLIVAFMPALSPITGSILLSYFGWRSIFVFFLILLFATLIWFLFRFPETHLKRGELKLHQAFKQYGALIRSPHFWRYSICYAAFTGTLLGYYGAMPFWYVSQWGVADKHYAYLALFSVAAYMISLLLCRYLVKRIALDTLLMAALVLGVLSGFIALALSFFHLHGVIYLVLIMSLFAFSVGMIFPTANAGVLNVFHHRAAIASALMTFFTFGMTGVFSWIESHYNVLSLWPPAIGITITSLIALVSFKLLSRAR
jgi:MFS transporter, DHA1 family, 2-module integral membrane pump EmrD